MARFYVSTLTFWRKNLHISLTVFGELAEFYVSGKRGHWTPDILSKTVLFGETAAARAKEIGASERTLHYQADQFDQHGMVSLFSKKPVPSPDKGRSLPPDMRQLIVDLKAEYPSFRPHELARICFLRFGRKPSDHTIQRVLADGPKPSVTTR